MKTSSAKGKARRLQDQVCSDLRSIFPVLDGEDIYPAIMGQSGLDVRLSPHARAFISYGIECKNVEKISIWGAWKQAYANAHKSSSDKHPPLIPIVVFKRNHEDPYVAIHEHDLPFPFGDKFWGAESIIRDAKGDVWKAIRSIRKNYPKNRIIEITRTLNHQHHYLIVMPWAFFMTVIVEKYRRDNPL